MPTFKLTVEDSGIEISGEALPDLCGTELGWAIWRSLCELMNGNLGVHWRDQHWLLHFKQRFAKRTESAFRFERWIENTLLQWFVLVPVNSCWRRQSDESKAHLTGVLKGLGHKKTMESKFGDSSGMVPWFDLDGSRNVWNVRAWILEKEHNLSSVPIMLSQLMLW